MSKGNNVGSELNHSSEDEQTRISALTTGEFEAMVIRTFQRVSELIMENFLRVVKEEFATEKMPTSMMRNSGNEISTSESRRLQLQFLNKISLPVLTGKKLKGEGGISIEVALVDGLSGEVVKTGPEAAAKVEIVLLEGDFDCGEGVNWTLEEFNNKIVRERDGKKSFLRGNTNLKLKEGIGSVGEINFTHNSGWMKSSEFRLGARVVDKFFGIRIKEAKTEPFMVKDCRSNLYGKRYPPFSSDQVWRLKKIVRDGAMHKRLNQAHITTVKDFLTLSSINPQSLHNILDTTANTWKAIMAHAWTCKNDKGVYLYYYPSSQQNTGVVFNVEGHLMGLLVEGQYITIDKFSESVKEDACKSVKSASEHWEEVVSFDDESSLTQYCLHSSSAFHSLTSPRLEILNDHNLGTPPVHDRCDPSQPSMQRSCGKNLHLSESRNLQLMFKNALCLPVFTGTRIEAEEHATLKVALVDALTGQVVSDRPESSAKVEIVVLEGDFAGDEGDNWSLEEFEYNIVREREGKKPLLTGDALFNLEEGIGLVGEISFTDNSSWTRSFKFRLGARVVDNCDGIRVREANTESFIVGDHHGELYKKHHPPSLSDEVWRLEKIGKEGVFHRRLSRENVNTVKEFLTLLFLDPTRLRNILGTGMSAKMWDVTVEHASTCVLDKRLHLYCPESPQKTRVVFNVVGQVMGQLSGCQFVPADKLSETEKANAHNLVISAYKHWEEVISFDDEASLIDHSLSLSNVLYPSKSPMIGSSDGCNISPSHEIDRFDYQQLNASPPNIMPSTHSMVGVSSLADYGLFKIDPMNVSFDPPLSFSCSSFFEDEHLQYFDNECSLQNSSLESQADLRYAVNGFLLARSVAIDKAKRKWTLLISLLRWSSMMRKAVRETPVRKMQRCY